MPPALYRELAVYYDRIYAQKEYGPEARELLRLAARHLKRRPASLLDVACGTGRHLEQFRKQVRDVEGVDLNRPMLREARRRLGAQVPLHRADMRSFDLHRQFDVVVCLFSAIGYLLTRSDRDRALSAFYRHTRPGGILLVEGWVRPAAWRSPSVHLQSYQGPEATIVRLSSTSRTADRSLVRMQYLIGVPGRPIRHVVDDFRNALIEPSELLGSFRRAGFAASARFRGRYRDRGLYIGRRPIRST